VDIRYRPDTRHVGTSTTIDKPSLAGGPSSCTPAAVIQCSPALPFPQQLYRSYNHIRSIFIIFRSYASPSHLLRNIITRRCFCHPASLGRTGRFSNSYQHQASRQLKCYPRRYQLKQAPRTRQTPLQARRARG